MKTAKETTPYKVPFPIINVASHMERTFQYWTVKNPTTQDQIERSSVFIGSLLITIFWPITDLIVNALLLSLIWLLLSLTDRPMNRLFLMTNTMLNISFLYYLMHFFIQKAA